MTTMLEKAALAAVIADMEREGDSPLEIAAVRQFGGASALQEYGPLVRAALLAIREPTEAMLAAMMAVDFIDYGEADEAGQWRAGIDAILGESDGPTPTS
jgi:hypothetical protein